MHNYNDILRELRENKKLTQTALGKEFNLTQRQISTYEIGRNEPEYNILIKYATYFDVSTDYILGLTKDPTPYWKKTREININNSFNNIGNNNKIKIKWGDKMTINQKRIVAGIIIFLALIGTLIILK